MESANFSVRRLDCHENLGLASHKGDDNFMAMHMQASIRIGHISLSRISLVIPA
ncbi:hypothetical protein [Ralstonia solanacearum]|uniref:hypothetical protein n=1 Tax=Ralstonia solanacearum TaxID=305 RepID=UPI000AC32B6E|nr:hypothetical protein [Ralstonia solanacearum]